MVTFKLEGNAALTGAEKALLSEAKRLPAVYDDDSPALTDSMEQAFAAARRKKPYRGEPLTLYVSPSTLEKAKNMGSDYLTILGQLLETAVDEYQTSL